MDALVLQAVLPELLEELEGRPVTKVELAGRFGVLLRFGGSRRLLYLSAHPELSRLGLLDEPPRLGEPRPGPANLSEPLRGSRLIGVAQAPGDRVATLAFANEDQRHREPRLIAELIPRFANVILVGNEDRILWSAREFGGERVREVRAGRPYVAPKADPGVSLSAVDAAILSGRLEETDPDRPFHRRLPRAWGGGARGFVRVLEEAGADVPERLLEIARAARSPVPRLARRAGERDLFLFPVDPGEIPGWELLPAAGPNATADAWYRPREAEESAGSLLVDLRRLLTRRRGRAAKALLQIGKRLGDSDRAEELRAHAELLAAHQGEIRRGMKSVRLPSFQGDGEIEIALDPRLDAAANVEAKFKKARRTARGRDELLMQKSIQETEVTDADAGLAALDDDPTPARLREVALEHAPSLLADRSPRAGSKDRAAEPERHPSLPEGFSPRVYELPGGWIVWVGRSAKQNDELSHRRASQKDLWFHARGAQGSHTVLRISSGKGEPPREILEMTASIAAFHSKARKSKLVPVAYCEKRYVRKPRGAPVGTAAIMREKVLMVEPREPAGTTR